MTASTLTTLVDIGWNTINYNGTGVFIGTYDEDAISSDSTLFLSVLLEGNEIFQRTSGIARGFLAQMLHLLAQQSHAHHAIEVAVVGESLLRDFMRRDFDQKLVAIHHHCVIELAH